MRNDLSPSPSGLRLSALSEKDLRDAWIQFVSARPEFIAMRHEHGGFFGFGGEKVSAAEKVVQ
jgi:hypothetical protein